MVDCSVSIRHGRFCLSALGAYRFVAALQILFAFVLFSEAIAAQDWRYEGRQEDGWYSAGSLTVKAQ